MKNGSPMTRDSAQGRQSCRVSLRPIFVPHRGCESGLSSYREARTAFATAAAGQLLCNRHQRSVATETVTFEPSLGHIKLVATVEALDVPTTGPSMMTA